MRSLTITASALAAALATAAAAQPYGLGGPGYWESAGTFEPRAGSDRVGGYTMYIHRGGRDGNSATVYEVLVYDQEQLSPAKRSYWQTWKQVTFVCGQNKYVTVSRKFYNRPQTAGGDAALLWEESYPFGSEPQAVAPNTQGDSIMKQVC